ncbi:MAG: Ig-like domain-containing protein, partial [Synergistaceae bacterium]|nr:Ig-like domain-containing protein [Synergistaceae bacterium]
GSSMQVSATLNGTAIDPALITWTTSDAAVATVTNGLITAISEGTATITGTYYNGFKTYTATITVTVKKSTPYGPIVVDGGGGCNMLGGTSKMLFAIVPLLLAGYYRRKRRGSAI